MIPMPNRIKTETKDLIILDEKWTMLGLLFLATVMIIVGGLLLASLYVSSESFWLGVIGVFSIALGGWFFLFPYGNMVTIDGKARTVIIQRRSIIKSFESVKKIPFSHVKGFEIYESYCGEGDECWKIRLAQFYDKPMDLYFTLKKSNANAVADKIHKITGKEMFRKI